MENSVIIHLSLVKFKTNIHYCDHVGDRCYKLETRQLWSIELVKGENLCLHLNHGFYNIKIYFEHLYMKTIIHDMR